MEEEAQACDAELQPPGCPHPPWEAPSTATKQASTLMKLGPRSACMLVRSASAKLRGWVQGGVWRATGGGSREMHEHAADLGSVGRQANAVAAPLLQFSAAHSTFPGPARQVLVASRLPGCLSPWVGEAGHAPRLHAAARQEANIPQVPGAKALGVSGGRGGRGPHGMDGEVSRHATRAARLCPRQTTTKLFSSL